MDPSTGVLVWWAALSAIAVANICFFCFTVFDLSRTRPPESDVSHRQRIWQTALSAVFVFGCAFRSFLPRAEGQRLCMTDSWISDAPIARMVATLAELAFVAQVALVLSECSRVAGSRLGMRLARAMVPLIALAECCSWFAALTTNFMGSVFEESIWAITFTIALAGFASLRGRFNAVVDRAIGIAVLVAACYVLFMVTVDVPMYVHRVLRDREAGRQFLSIAEGWRDSWQRRVVSRRWEDWREEMPWMTLYFSVAVWLSIGMAWAPRILPERALLAARRPFRPATARALS